MSGKRAIDPGEAVGVIAAQSIGEPGTQMCVSYDEKIIIKHKNKIRIVKIGNFVDKVFKKAEYKKINGYEVYNIPLNEDISVLSVNKNEKIEWRRVYALNRHKSPNKLIKIKTNSGRQIIATDFHSFVTRKNNEILPIAGRDLKVGDRIPVVQYIPEHCMTSLHINDYLEDSGLIEKNGFLFKQRTKSIKNTMKLDNSSGWFIGAYLAEGFANEYSMSISNIDDSYINNAKEFVKDLTLNYTDRFHHRGFADGRDLVINSTLLSKFIITTCGRGSDYKKVPDFAYSADDKFVSGLLRSYFDGDGNFHVTRKMIRVSSNSKELIDGIALLLSRFKIFSFKVEDKKDQYWLLIPYKYAPLFLKYIGSDIDYNRKNLEKLAESAKNFWDTKSQDYTDMISGFGDILYRIAKKLKYPTRYVNNFTKRQKIGRTTLYRYIKLFTELSKEKRIDINNEIEILKRMFNSDVVWDEITSIEYVDSEHEYVYDLSVPQLETFTTFDGIITHNTMRTFHYAGVAEQVPTGLPRLIEIVDVRRSPKKPTMDIYLTKEYSKDEESARKMAERIEEVSLSKIAEIRESFASKEIQIIPDEDVMKEQGLSVGEITKKIKNAVSGSVRQEGNVIIIKPKTTLLRSVRRATNKLKSLHIKGINGISRVVVLKGDGEYFIRTGGSNFEQVLKWDGINSSRSYTNNIKEVEKILGIEAARNAIIKEAKQVLDMQKLDVDARHIMLLADAMTMNGEITPVGRHGLSGEKVSILARAAFEETIKHLITAAVKADEDRLLGVTENVIVGQEVPIGTGTVKLSMKAGKK
jgi:DNA-directed RNA polymerase subunit A"